MERLPDIIEELEGRIEELSNPSPTPNVTGSELTAVAEELKGLVTTMRGL